MCGWWKALFGILHLVYADGGADLPASCLLLPATSMLRCRVAPLRPFRALGRNMQGAQFTSCARNPGPNVSRIGVKVPCQARASNEMCPSPIQGVA
jgi:hypothetical protein